jgi:CRISPR-associated protein Cas5t
MLRLKIYQETAHFRIPTIGNPYLSYPLPPPSTIYGFLRFITDYESINPDNTKLSIQGFFEGISLEKETLFLETKKEHKTNIISIQKLHQCHWIIHIDSKDYEEKIVNALEKSYKILRLGRKEDLIIDINVETIEEKEFDQQNDNYNKETKIYKKWEKDKDLDGSLFKMALDTVVDNNKKIIGYKYVDLVYTTSRRVASNCKKFDGTYLIEWI